MNGRRKTRSHRIGPGGIRCICCRPANKSLSKRIASREQRRAGQRELATETLDATRSRSDEQSLSMYLEELHESLLGIETRELEEDVLWGERERGAA
jgi:hypothetical protein